MTINVNDQWQISSDIRSWTIRERRRKSGNSRSVAWARNLDEAKHYLLQRGVPQTRFDALGEMLGWKDPFEKREARPFCSQLDEIFPACSL